MEELGLTAEYRRAFKRTTIADPNAKVRGELVKRQFNPPVPTTGICGDITYLRTSQGLMYLATVIDLSTRMVIGWQVADRMTTTLIIDALAMAHRAGFVAGNAIFHSNRGSQYTSARFAEYAASIDVRLSVGEVGVCWDNAVAESFFSTLKLHLMYGIKQFPTKLEARIRRSLTSCCLFYAHTPFASTMVLPARTAGGSSLNSLWSTSSTSTSAWSMATR